MPGMYYIRLANIDEIFQVHPFDPNDPGQALLENFTRIVGNVYHLSRIYRLKSIGLYVHYVLERAKTWVTEEEGDFVLNVEVPTTWTYPSTVELLSEMAASKYRGNRMKLTKRVEMGINPFLNQAVASIQRMQVSELQGLVDVPDNVARAFIAKLRGEQQTLLRNLVIGKLLAAGKLYAPTQQADAQHTICVRCGNVLDLQRNRCPKCFSAHQGVKFQVYVTAWQDGEPGKEYLVFPIEPLKSILSNPTSPLFEQTTLKELVLQHFNIHGDSEGFVLMDQDRSQEGTWERTNLLLHGRRLALVPSDRAPDIDDPEIYAGLRFSDVCADFIQLRVTLPGNRGTVAHSVSPETRLGDVADAVVNKAGLKLADAILVRGGHPLDREGTVGQAGLVSGDEVTVQAVAQLAVFIPEIGGTKRFGVPGRITAAQAIDLLKTRCSLTGDYVLSQGSVFLTPDYIIDPAALGKGAGLRLNRLITVGVQLVGNVHTISVSAESTVGDLLSNLKLRAGVNGVLVAQLKGAVVPSTTLVGELDLKKGQNLAAVERQVKMVNLIISPIEGGKDTKVSIAEDQTVSSLKVQLRTMLGLPDSSRLDLVFGEKVLKDDASLMESGVGEGANLFLMG